MRALLAALECVKGDIAANLAAHLQLLADAAAVGCDLVVLPEFSLTGSVDPLSCPSDAITIDDAAIAAMVAATAAHRVAAVFGLAECAGDEFFITQAVAAAGELVGTQRKRYLGEDEIGYSIGGDALVFERSRHRFGVVICAEAGVDWTWEATVNMGADVVLFCSAPGLYGRKTDEASWREGFEWWEGCGLGDAQRQARRLGIWVAMATQAGVTHDEDFPGIAALISPRGEVVDRLPDWRPGTLIVDF